MACENGPHAANELQYGLGYRLAHQHVIRKTYQIDKQLITLAESKPAIFIVQVDGETVYYTTTI